MANNKKHMYLNNGAFVTDKLNPGLQALAKERPDVVKKILKIIMAVTGRNKPRNYKKEYANYQSNFYSKKRTVLDVMLHVL